jgi:hypothetical protein
VLHTLLQKVLEPGRVQKPPLWLHDEQAGAGSQAGTGRAIRTPIECSTEHCAVRLEGNEYFRFLKGEPLGLRHLPDYLVFAEPPRREREGGTALWVLVCELKSSQKGARDVSAGGKSALRQIQLGRFLVDYLVRLARYQDGKSYPTKKECWQEIAEVSCAGMVVHPEAPALLPKPRTRGGPLPISGQYDGLAGQWVRDWRSGDVLRLEDVFST